MNYDNLLTILSDYEVNLYDDIFNSYRFKAKNRDELKISVYLYSKDEKEVIKIYGIIGTWDVSSVRDMSYMFYDIKFDGDLSGWDVSNVTHMNTMFYDSKFNGDISCWDVSNVTDMSWVFASSKFNGDISDWDVSDILDIL